MLKKLKKIMVVAAAAVMLSAGFATIAPKEASAHWADTQMNWALNNGYLTADLRDNLATRQDAWLIMGRVWQDYPDFTMKGAHNLASQLRVAEDGRPTNWVTREEMGSFLYSFRYLAYTNKPWPGFPTTTTWAVGNGIYDGSRPQAFATRAEVVTMIYTANRKGLLQPLN
ncbi:protein phosphatase 2C [Bacillus toyonensis]|uniref:protein phosphatase 2C n=1 Tax=Bacillus toyonensis TaxID=155322 RepID=UPI003019D8FD